MIAILAGSLPSSGQGAPSPDPQEELSNLRRDLEVATREQKPAILLRMMDVIGPGNPQEVIAVSRQALGLLEAREDPASVFQALRFKAWAHMDMSDWDSAATVARGALTVALTAGIPEMERDAQYLVGTTYYRVQPDSALSHLLIADGLADRTNDLDLRGRILNLIGATHFEDAKLTGDHESFARALEYFEQSAAIKEDLGDVPGRSNSLNNVGLVYRHQGVLQPRGSAERTRLLEKSLDVHLLTLDLRRGADPPSTSGIAQSLTNIGLVLADIGRHGEAVRHHLEAGSLYEALGYTGRQANALVNLSQSLRGIDRHMEALHYAQQARELARSIPADIDLNRDAVEELAVSFEATGRFEEATEAYKQLRLLEDSVRSATSQDNLHRLQTEYGLLQAEREREIAQQRLEIQNLWNLLLLGGVLALFLVVGLLYSRNRLRNRSHAALESAHADLAHSLQQLTETQDRLIHAEKMASLGQLTAGIAHEIKNPLNFVNNFSDLTAEIVDELLARVAQGPDKPLSTLVEDLQDLKENAGQITKHGRRADGIVKSMLEHSGTSSGDLRPVNINGLVEEYANLAYHGALAAMPDLVATLEKEFDRNAGEVPCIPQEIGRVLINLFNNAFYAVHEFAAEAGASYVPTVRVATRAIGDIVEIEVRDNGQGIPADAMEHIFEPFYTTKPTGTGTGLGLSLSYDIVTSGHAGSMSVESSPGRGATFVISLQAGSRLSKSSIVASPDVVEDA